ncbi:MAG: PilZ domain-containing protein, partial [Acidobacteriales bacterium]|nr:PilZ domain-containing protein [Terriglobales bacterium]
MASPISSLNSDAVRRRTPRFPVAVPVNITVLRSGIPDNVPGRLLDLGESGAGAAVAGEFLMGDSVGVEFRLPQVRGALKTKAVVRHQGQLRCGLEFIGLSPEQRTIMQEWLLRGPAIMPQVDRGIEPELERQAAPIPAGAMSSSTVAPESQSSQSLFVTPMAWEQEVGGAQASERSVAEGVEPVTHAIVMRRVVFVVLVLGLLGGGWEWRHWRRAWQELDSHVPAKPAITQPLASVPAEEMSHLLLHKVEPVLPESVTESESEGAVALRAIIGNDGRVLATRPVSGPAVL